MPGQSGEKKDASQAHRAQSRMAAPLGDLSQRGMFSASGFPSL